MSDVIDFVILGEPASKANSRKIVMFGKRPAVIKSEKARAYVELFAFQCPKLPQPLEGDLEAWIQIWYASRRPDLDESVILDCMQGPILGNDRQVKRRLTEWGLDKANPRCRVRIGPVGSVLPVAPG